MACDGGNGVAISGKDIKPYTIREIDPGRLLFVIAIQCRVKREDLGYFDYSTPLAEGLAEVRQNYEIISIQLTTSQANNSNPTTGAFVWVKPKSENKKENNDGK